MSSLTQTAITTRKVIRYGIFFIAFMVIGRMLLSVGIKIYKKAFPAPPPPPTITYGKLPKLAFSATQLPSNITFTLETADGVLPKMPTQSKVFFMPKPSANLLSLSVAQQRAEKLGFNPNSQQVSSTTYRFPHQENPSTLEFNIVSGIFSISYDLKADPIPISVRPPIPEVAASVLRSYLSSADLLPADLTGTTTHEFLKLSDNKLVSALSQSESKLIKINLFRKTYDNLPVLPPNPNNANVWFLISGTTDRQKQVISGEFHYFPVDESQFATYPIKTSDIAWKEFTEGKASVANLGNNKEGNTIKIRKIYLAYYDPGIPTDFMQPIYVFEGDNGFTSYLPAVTSDYYGN